MTTRDILIEDDRRIRIFDAPFDPITGEGSTGERFLYEVKGLPLERQWLPVTMKGNRLLKELKRQGVEKFLQGKGEGAYMDLCMALIRLRNEHDFPFWCASFVKIKSKMGGNDIPLILTYPQRKTLELLESMRTRNLPIRMILLKARQWGGSTLVQIYMAWIQLIHKEGFYSAIVAHVQSSANTIRAMYSKMIKAYPSYLLDLPEGKLELKPYERSSSDVTITMNGEAVRDNVICIGSMESPDSIRGGDIALAHYSEVGLWKKTLSRTPSDIVRSVSSSILYLPLTVEVMESTANGEGTFFHQEWLAAVNGSSIRKPMFVAWWEIPLYRLPFEKGEREEFAKDLYSKRKSRAPESTREEPGCYLWYLFEIGATLESIHWYVNYRKGVDSHAVMASEFPTDPQEAFQHSGQMVFDRTYTERLRASCRPPLYVGEIAGEATEGKRAMEGLHFVEKEGCLKIWELPDDIECSDRYVVATDVGGRAYTSDYSDIVVIDRYPLTQGDLPSIVAEWHGHIRHDLLAWKMAQIAKFYNKALLVVEANTFETKDQDTEGDHSDYILSKIADVYPNMYAREASAEKIRQGFTHSWGFHTNVKTKQDVINNLIRYIEDSMYIEREESVITEYNVYRRNPNGSMEAGDGYHDDRLMARAIGLWISENLPIPAFRKKGTFKFERPQTEATL